MTFESTFLAARITRFSRLLTLSLCAAFAAQASAMTMPRWFCRSHAPQASKPTAPASLPYLARLGATPLRFAPPAPEAVERPAAPVALPASSSSAHDSMDANANPPPMLPAADEVKPVDSAPKLLRILPDDTPHDIRAEDVMPYFQLPQQREAPNASNPNLPSAPGQSTGSMLPTSSATYQQK